MYWDDAELLSRYWAKVPPLRDLVAVIAQAVGWEPAEGGGGATPAEPMMEPPEFEDGADGYRQ